MAGDKAMHNSLDCWTGGTGALGVEEYEKRFLGGKREKVRVK